MSGIKLICDYWHERYPARIFVPFAILLAGAGSAAGGSLPTIRGVISSFALAYGLVLFFRVVDDLADLPSDTLHHPERKLVKAANRASIFWFALMVALANIALILSLPHRWARASIFAAILVCFLTWYAWRGSFPLGPLGQAHVLLLKYPAIVLLACSRWDSMTLHTALPACAAIYLGLAIYEQIHDDNVRESGGAQWIFAAELGLLVSLPLLLLGIQGFQL